MLGSGDDAEDVLQSVFLRAFRNLGGCSNPARFHAWLFQIVINECRTFATRRAQRDERLVHDLRVLDTPDRSAIDESPIDREMIHRAVERLPAEQREAFLLKHVEELEYDEIAELTGASVPALKMRVKRACERLRNLLEEVDNVRTSS
jgi:RNA polymerase sigma-70 factor (ECF subfamily)